jgi:hypothetical protein
MRLPFQPEPGFVTDDTVFTAPGRYKTGAMVRFYQGQWQTIGGWQNLNPAAGLTGVCRGLIQWSDANSVLNVGFGTHTNLQVWKGGALYDVTPTKNRPPMTLGANPLSVTNGSAVVTVTWSGHGLSSTDVVNVSGAAAVGGITPNISGAAVTKIDANSFTYTFTSNATGTATGGGSAVIIAPQAAFATGQIDGTGGAGYGTGAYGVGTYGSPSTTDYFPRTWALGIYETGDLYANPRGGTIFRWQQNTAAVATPLDNAPYQVTAMLCNAQRQVMALGCNHSADGIFDHLCIRWSDIENPTVWTETSANNAGEYVLNGDGRIVGGVVLGSYILVFTDVALYLGTYVGDPGETWRFDRLGRNCGLIGPNAVAVGFGHALSVAWISPDAQFWSYTLGGVPTPIDCPIRKDFADNIAAGQNDKIYAATVSSFKEVRWFYPDSRDGLENSRDLTLSDEGWWNGLLARTAFVDAGPGPSPIGVTRGGAIYWHELGQSADGGVLTGYIETTDFYASEAQASLKLNGMWPNFKDQVGALQMTIYARDYPQAPERTYGPWALAPGQSKRAFRVTGKVYRVRFDFSSTPSYARMGKCEFDAEQVGGR